MKESVEVPKATLKMLKFERERDYYVVPDQSGKGENPRSLTVNVGLTARGAGKVRAAMRSMRRLSKFMWRQMPSGSLRAWRRSTLHSAPNKRRHGRSQPSRRRTR